MSYYVGFDLDETLGRFSTPYAHIFLLAPEVFYRINPIKPKEPVPPETVQRCRNAFDIFARCLADQEPALGMLRPGIFDIIERIGKYKDEGRVKGSLIYSNNGNLGLLYLAAKMIEYRVGRPNFFCAIIDWFHPIRNENDVRGDVGVATKSARTLRKGFLASGCLSLSKLSDIPTSQLIFFDDLDPPHEDLFYRLGPERYFKVNPYKWDVAMEPITNCFKKALHESQLDTDEAYLKYIAPILGTLGKPATIAGIFEYLDHFNHGFVPKRQVFHDDTASILEKLQTLFPPLPSPPVGASASSASSASASASSSPAGASLSTTSLPEAPLNSYGYNYFPVSGGRKRARRTIKQRHRRGKYQKQKTRGKKARKN